MEKLLGIIAPLRKFLSNTTESIRIPFNHSSKEILSLEQNRTYIIPDFQREIRWNSNNISLLIDDIISGPKYLGNVILTAHPDNKYSIIDGQQRITILTMILTCIKTLHETSIDTLTPCTLEIESFTGFSQLIEHHFDEELHTTPEIAITDKLRQLDKYYELWAFIFNHPTLVNKRLAQSFLNNLSNSNINIILNQSDNTNDGISYFIDVNLKGRQLDTEDIFKSYLFKNDQSPDIRNAWYELKTNVALATENDLNYTLLKYLEHYFYCDLYQQSKYKGLEFGEEFLSKNEFKTKESSPQSYRKGDHLIELVGDKQYMLHSLITLNNAICIMIDIVSTSAPTHKFKKYFLCKKNNGSFSKMDETELTIIHNFMRKILKDSNIVPKSLVLKFILSTLIPNFPFFSYSTSVYLFLT